MKNLIILALSGLLAASCASTTSENEDLPRPGDTADVIHLQEHGPPRDKPPSPTHYVYGDVFRNGYGGNEILLTSTSPSGKPSSGIAGRAGGYAYVRGITSPIGLGTSGAVMALVKEAQPHTIFAESMQLIIGPKRDTPRDWSVTWLLWPAPDMAVAIIVIDLDEAGGPARFCMELREGDKVSADGKVVFTAAGIDDKRQACTSKNVEDIVDALAGARSIAVTPASGESATIPGDQPLGSLSHALALARWVKANNSAP